MADQHLIVPGETVKKWPAFSAACERSPTLFMLAYELDACPWADSLAITQGNVGENSRYDPFGNVIILGINWPVGRKIISLQVSFWYKH